MTNEFIPIQLKSHRKTAEKIKANGLFFHLEESNYKYLKSYLCKNPVNLQIHNNLNNGVVQGENKAQENNTAKKISVKEQRTKKTRIDTINFPPLQEEEAIHKDQTKKKAEAKKPKNIKNKIIDKNAQKLKQQTKITEQQNTEMVIKKEIIVEQRSKPQTVDKKFYFQIQGKQELEEFYNPVVKKHKSLWGKYACLFKGENESNDSNNNILRDDYRENNIANENCTDITDVCYRLGKLGLDQDIHNMVSFAFDE
jgi:hypothetical protein